MTATFPTSVRPYVSRTDLVDTVIADNINSLQEEIKAIEGALGTTATNQNPLVSTWSGTFSQGLLWSTISDRFANLEAGLINGVTNAPYVNVSGGSTITTSSNKGLILRTGSGTSNLLETYNSSFTLGFNLDSSGNPKVGSSNIVYVGSSDYNALTAATSAASAAAALKIPLATVTASGDLIIGSGNATVTNLAKGTSGQSLIMSGSTVAWGTPTDPTKIPLSTVTSAGDLIVGSSNGAVTRLGAGTSGQVLTSNGSSLSWQTPTTYLATANASVTAASTSLGVVRNTWVSNTAPTSGQGSDGDIWIVYQ